MKERVIFFYIVSLGGLVLSFLQSGGALLERRGLDASVSEALGSAGLAGAPWTQIPLMAGSRPDSVQTTVAVLAASVLVSMALLLYLLRRDIAGRVATFCALALTIWAAGPASLPMAAAAAFSFSIIKNRRIVTIIFHVACFCAVHAAVFWPGPMIIITTTLLSGFSLYALRLMEKIRVLEKHAEGSAGRAEEMREMLGNQRRMARSTEHVSRLEERNRLAARIHDEIGHGMSGSILLLEGAELVMDKDPSKARETICKVTENLRESVEEIRRVLREERPVGADVSLARIENELTAFEADHPHIKTRFEAEGDMGSVNNAVWVCVYENLVEALTNVLKHSAATTFTVRLKNSGALLRVEFADNGGAPGGLGSEEIDNGGRRAAPGGPGSGEIRPGIGLHNMEERAAMCYGRCFFRHEEDGFHIVMAFPRKENI